MRRFTITREAVFSGHTEPLEPSSLEELLEDVTAHLAEMAGIADPDVGGDLRSGEVHLSVDVDAADIGAALTIGDGAMRTALHACGVATPSWDEPEAALLDDPIAELSEGTFRVEASALDA